MDFYVKNYSFVVNLDDYQNWTRFYSGGKDLKDLQFRTASQSVMYGSTLSHELGHIQGTLNNLYEDYYFGIVLGDSEGHAEGNPSGEAAVAAEKKFDNAYYGK
jgi:hypothetical protein